jgi:hypothetical protein
MSYRIEAGALGRINTGNRDLTDNKVLFFWLELAPER